MDTLKKASSMLLSLMLTASICGSAAAEFAPPTMNPYSFGPEGRPIESLEQSFGKPNEMMNILPNRPVAAREKDGSRVYFSPDGKMTLKVNNDGSKEYSLGWKSKTVNAKGELQKQSAVEKGTNEVVTKNEKGEVLSYQKIENGKVSKEYDYQKNLTKSYSYDKFGKNIAYVLDELSQTKTVFDKNGQPKQDLDFEGNVVAKYSSDPQGRLTQKVDAVGNVTYFDKKGNMTYTANMFGATILTYVYETDSEGRYVLTKAENGGDVTYYKDGKQQYTVNSLGLTTVEYHWDGSKLMYSYDNGAQETTYYDVNGKQIYTAFNGNLVKEWLYFKGRLVGYYDGNSGTTQLFQFQREDIKIDSQTTRPSADQIQKWYDDGLIERQRNELPVK